MANPYLNYFSSQSSNVSVNDIKANAFGNIIFNIDSIPDLESRLNNSGTSNVSKLDDLTDVVVSDIPLNNIRKLGILVTFHKILVIKFKVKKFFKGWLTIEFFKT